MTLIWRTTHVGFRVEGLGLRVVIDYFECEA